VAASHSPLLRKICGMRETQNIAEIATLEPDFMGFIFYPPSKRFAGDTLDPSALKQLPPHTKKVGVFVNASDEDLQMYVERYDLDILQLHGDESATRCVHIRELLPSLTLWKAFGVDEDFDFDVLTPYTQSCARFVFDTKSKQYGGTGRTFRWDLLEAYPLTHPFFLSGGLNTEHTEEIKRRAQLWPALCGVDLNSQFELRPGFKSFERLKQMFHGLDAKEI